MRHPRKQFALFALLAVVSGPAVFGLLRLRAEQDDAAIFAKRDAWQRPEEVMDELGVKSGSVVADVGCGSGYFVIHLASRVGPTGKVYAEDVDSGVLRKLQARVRQDKLTQVEVLEGTPDDPFLPAGTLDSILVVNAYHEMKNYDAMLRGMYRALKPGGLLAIIDHEASPGQPRSEYQESHRIPEELVREDLARNGFQFLRNSLGFESTDSGKKYFFLIFGKPATLPEPH